MVVGGFILIFVLGGLLESLFSLWRERGVGWWGGMMGKGKVKWDVVLGR